MGEAVEKVALPEEMHGRVLQLLKGDGVQRLGDFVRELLCGGVARVRDAFCALKGLVETKVVKEVCVFDPSTDWVENLELAASLCTNTEQMHVPAG